MISEERIRRAVAFRWPDRAAPPFAMPAKGEVAVSLKPAGLLLVVPEVVPDPALGSFRLRRTDGLPIPFVKSPPPESRKSKGTPRPEARVAVDIVAGLQIGPFLPGRRRFTVELGGKVLGEVTAVVRAGRTSPLAIPLRGLERGRGIRR